MSVSHEQHWFATLVTIMVIGVWVLAAGIVIAGWREWRREKKRRRR